MKNTLVFFLLLISGNFTLSAQAIDPFMTSWAVSTPDTISIPLQSGTYDFDYRWVLMTDTTIQITGTHTNADGDFETQFIIGGSYLLEIDGQFPHLRNYPKDKLQDVLQWGDISWRNMLGTFENWPGSSFTAVDTPDLSQVTNMQVMFSNAFNFDDDLNHWDVSNVREMARLFQGASAFNGDISSWDVSDVINMSASFNNALLFNSNISGWDVAKVENMRLMFRNARNFDQDIGSWNTSEVRHMENMFRDARIFNQAIGSWDVGKVVDMSDMFRDARKFNQELSDWDVSGVLAMRQMFRSATDFNQSVGGWKFDSTIVFLNTFLNTNMDCQAWSSTLVGWNFSNPQLENINVVGPNTEYDVFAAIALDELENQRGWTISGTPFSGDCASLHTFPCRDTQEVSHDILFANIVIGAAEQIILDSLVVQHPGSIVIKAPDVHMNSGFEIKQGVEVEILAESGCP